MLVRFYVYKKCADDEGVAVDHEVDIPIPPAVGDRLSGNDAGFWHVTQRIWSEDFQSVVLFVEGGAANVTSEEMRAAFSKIGWSPRG